jgi:PilZ domain
MQTAATGFTGRERRRHFRVVGEWQVRVVAGGPSPAVPEFAARVLNISLSGVLLETDVPAELGMEHAVRVEFPHAGGAVPGRVRRFLSYGREGTQVTRAAIELDELSSPERAMWTRFLFGEARRLGQEGAHREFLARRSL